MLQPDEVCPFCVRALLCVGTRGCLPGGSAAVGRHDVRGGAGGGWVGVGPWPAGSITEATLAPYSGRSTCHPTPDPSRRRSALLGPSSRPDAPPIKLLSTWPRCPSATPSCLCHSLLAFPSCPHYLPAVGPSHNTDRAGNGMDLGLGGMPRGNEVWPISMRDSAIDGVLLGSLKPRRSALIPRRSGLLQSDSAYLQPRKSSLQQDIDHL